LESPESAAQIGVRKLEDCANWSGWQIGVAAQIGVAYRHPSEKLLCLTLDTGMAHAWATMEARKDKAGEECREIVPLSEHSQPGHILARAGLTNIRNMNTVSIRIFILYHCIQQYEYKYAQNQWVMILEAIR
jgi:hypothetical protein